MSFINNNLYQIFVVLSREFALLDKVPALFYYVALSYVWGRADPKETDPLPQVILDAMAVTKKLGYKFLWVGNIVSIKLAPTNKLDK